MMHDITGLGVACYDYHPQKPPLTIGQIVLENATGVRFHEAANLEVSVALYRHHENGGRSLLEMRPLRLERRDGSASGHRLVVTDEYLDGDLVFDVVLDMAAVPRLYVSTIFTLEVTIGNLDSRAARQTITRDFTLRPPADESDLALIIVQTPRIAKTFPLDNGGMYFAGEPPVIPPAGSGKVTPPVLGLRASNTAELDDRDAPRNVIVLKKIFLRGVSPELLGDYLFLRFRDSTDASCRLGKNTVIELWPQISRGEVKWLDIAVHVRADIREKLMATEVLGGEIVIEYQRFDVVSERHEDCVRAIPFDFSIQPNYASDILAIDFGTSAISMAVGLQRGADFGHTVLPLERQWQRLAQNKDGLTDETSKFCISSTLARNDGTTEVAPALNVTTHLIRFIKSHVGACKTDYVDAEGQRHSVAELVSSAYYGLYSQYLIPLATAEALEQVVKGADLYGSWQPRRIVLTHPNGYFDGQARFLRNQVRAALRRKLVRLDVLAISESDAVLYHFLYDQQRHRTYDFASSSRTILSYDMGAGTLDVSLRRIAFDADGMPEPDAAAHSLLGMVSVRGAGLELDHQLARLIDAKLEVARTIFENLLVANTVKATDFAATSLFAPPADGDAPLLRNLLNNIAFNIREAKKSVEAKQALHVTLKAADDLGNQRFYFDPNFLVAAEKEMAEHGFSLSRNAAAGGFNAIDIPLRIVLDHLAEHFLPQHLDIPLRALLIDETGKPETPDVVIISGRGALFPGIGTAVAAKVGELCPGSAPAIIHFGKDTGRLRTTVDAKTVVVDGAVLWAADSSTGREIFSTPVLFGAIGLAVRLSGDASWQWVPLVSATGGGSSILSGQCDPINGKLVLDMMVLHTTIRNPAEISRQLNEAADQDLRHLRRSLERDGYFLGLYVFPLEMVREFRRHGGPLRIGVTVSCALGDETDDTEFSPLNVEVFTLGDNNFRAFITEEPITSGAPLIDVHTWPASVFSSL